MRFALVNLVMLALAVLVAVVLARRGPAFRARPFLVAMAALTVLTVVFDNVMIAADLFTYGDEHRSGLQLGLAPVEDLAYPLGAAILLPALWLAGRRKDGER